MATGYKRPESALVVIHTPDLQILMLERAKHLGYWQSVTGSREGNESYLETAVREVYEETGLEIRADQLRTWPGENVYAIMAEWQHRYAPGVTHNHEHVFSLCLPAPIDITIAPDEHRAWRWQPCDEAAAACFSASNRAAILALKTMSSPCHL
jgi:dATP pyrophosphohydrolase